MKNFRDIEQLSAYLDGQLSLSDSARLESRMAADPELASTLNELRAARGILRKLPARKAPRNFTLTRKMVGLKPPLPRTFLFFRFSTAVATFLLMLTFAANVVLPRISLGAAAPAAPEAFGLGGGGGGCNEPCSPPASAPMATEAPSIDSAAAPTEILPTPSAEALRAGQAPLAGTPAPKGMGSAPSPQNQSDLNPTPAPYASAGKRGALIPGSWQVGILIVGLLSALIMFSVRQAAIRKWK